MSEIKTAPVVTPSAQRQWPFVSVVIITKGRHARAGKAVASVLQSDYPSECMEIVVVEETAAAQPFTGAGVVYVAIPELNRGFGYARNQGVAKAKGSIIVFTDDDCTVETEWLRELVRPILENETAGAVAGAVLVPPCGPVGQCENILGFPGGGVRYLHDAHGKTRECATFSTCNCAVRREAIEEAGGFGESFIHGGEDEFLSNIIRRTRTILYNPAARVFHDPRDSFAGVWRWFLRRGAARWGTLPHQPKPGVVRWHMVRNSPLARIILLVTLCALLKMPVLPLMAIVAVVYYGSIVWRFRWAREYYRFARTLALLPAVRAVMDVAMDLGTVRAMLTAQNNATGKKGT